MGDQRREIRRWCRFCLGLETIHTCVLGTVRSRRRSGGELSTEGRFGTKCGCRLVALTTAIKWNVLQNSIEMKEEP